MACAGRQTLRFCWTFRAAELSELGERVHHVVEALREKSVEKPFSRYGRVTFGSPYEDPPSSVQGRDPPVGQ
jgi:hypothetical protein